MADDVVDLRPPSESMKSQLYRLGLKYVFSQDSGEVWQDDSRGVRAMFKPDGSDVVLEDISTHETRTLDLDAMRGVTRIDTVIASD